MGYSDINSNSGGGLSSP